jgi:hypothetical protein
MPALSETDRITIIEARMLARADSRAEYMDALMICESPTMAAFAGDPGMEQATLYAAALGTLSGLAVHLCEIAERLAAELDRRGCEHRCTTGRDCGGCGCQGCGYSATWALWRVDELADRATEYEHMPRSKAIAEAAKLNQGPASGVHYVALPLGGLPSDAIEAAIGTTQ